MRRLKRVRGVALFAIAAIGFILRAYDLGMNSYWYDEAYMLLGAKLMSTYPVILKSSFQPLFILFLSLWKFLGESEWIMRLIPLCAGMATIGIAYKTGKELYGGRVGAIAALLLAVSPLHIWYSQEITVYAPLALFSALSTYCFIMFLNHRRTRWLVWFTVSAIISVNIHPFGVMAFFVQCLYFFAHLRQYRGLSRKMLLAFLCVGAAAIPYGITLYFGWTEAVSGLIEGYRRIKWIPAVPDMMNLVYTFKNFSVGYTAEVWFWPAATAVFFVLLIDGFIRIARKKHAGLMLLAVFLPILMTFLISRIAKSFYVDRYFIASLVPFYILAAVGAERLSRAVAIPAAAVLLLFTACALRNYYAGYIPGPEKEHLGAHMKIEHRRVCGFIAGELREGDVIFHTCKNTISPFKYYCAGMPFERSRPSQFLLRFPLKAGSPVATEYSIARNTFLARRDVPVAGNVRVFLIFSAWEFVGLQGPEANVVYWFDRHYRRVGEKRFRGIIVYIYERDGIPGKGHESA